MEKSLQIQKMPCLLDFTPELVITEQFPKYQVKINLKKQNDYFMVSTQ